MSCLAWSVVRVFVLYIMSHLARCLIMSYSDRVLSCGVCGRFDAPNRGEYQLKIAAGKALPNAIFSSQGFDSSYWWLVGNN